MKVARFFSTLVAAFGWFWAITHRAHAQTDKADGWQQQFEKRQFVGESNEQLLYRLLAPKKLREQQYPLVIFLHGAGERGNDNDAQLIHAMREFARDDRRTAYPAFVIAPQCPKDRKWVEVPWDSLEHVTPAEASLPLRLTRELIDRLVAELPIDPNRIYLTGLSMGGFGTFDALVRWPDLFAAALPVCGGGDDTEQAIARIKAIPLWAFHGDQDQIVSPLRSRKMIEALKKAGGHPRYTEFEGVDHDSWTRAYADEEIFRWMFSQVRSEKQR